MSGGSITSSTNSGANSTRGSPGVSASRTPAITRTIEGAVCSRRAISAAATSTANRTRRIWMLAVMAAGYITRGGDVASGLNLDCAGGNVDGQREQRGVEDERDDAVAEHGTADRLGGGGHGGGPRGHAGGGGGRNGG